MPHLIVKNVRKSFRSALQELVILGGVSFDAKRGQSVAIVGPSGCGKSTLLSILGALDVPTDGTVELDNVNPFALNADQVAAFRNERIGFVFQEHHLLPQLSALENVLLPLLACGPVDASATESARQLLTQVGLAERIDHLPAKLSGGERQRVAVARALIRNPSLLLADEPTGSLDQNNAKSIGRLLLDVGRNGNATLICVTHSLELASQFDRLLQLDHGTLTELDPSQAIAAKV
ncbi:MAG: ABC transporter ATP-binding protein [Pirellulaceae bacterium]